MRNIILVLLTALADVALCPPQVFADFVPPNLPPGSQYQLIFVTRDTRDAGSTDIADYNAFVTAQALLSPSLPTTQWHAVGSTRDVDAITNAPSGLGVAVYDTQGGVVVPSSASLYGLGATNRVPFDQFGQSVEGGHPVWTGSRPSGIASSFPLGGFLGYSSIGRNTTPFLSPDLVLSWLVSMADDGNAGNLTPTLLPLYALSDPITVAVPEPGTWALACISLLLSVASRPLFRRARKTSLF
jgi:hypothetical protein